MSLFFAHSARGSAELEASDLYTVAKQLPVEVDLVAQYRSGSGAALLFFWGWNDALLSANERVVEDANAVTILIGHLGAGMTDALAARQVLEQAHDQLKNGTNHDALERVAGQFLVVQLQKRTDTIFVLNDTEGSIPAYLRQCANHIFVSNRISLLDHHPSAEALRVDPINAAWHVTGGYIPGDATPFQHVMQLGEATLAEVRKGEIASKKSRCRVVPDGIGLDEVGNNLLENGLAEIGANVGSALQKGCIPEIGLSGGKDSRLILGGCLYGNLVRDVNFVTNGVDVHPDVVVARELAAEFGINHKVREPPPARPVDPDQVLNELIPRHIAFTEGTLNLFDLQGRGVQGGAPVIHGLNGENFRSVYDLPDHPGIGTESVSDRASLLSFIRIRAPFDHCKVVNPEILSEHEQLRENWVDRMLDSGLKPDLIASYYRTHFQSRPRNRNITKARIFWYPYISALSGPSLKAIETAASASERRNERAHFELMRLSDLRLVEHRFALQRWSHGLVGAAKLPEGLALVVNSDKERQKRADWKHLINIDADFKSKVGSHILDLDNSHWLWDIVNKNRLEKFLQRDKFSHMERFHLFGILTLAMSGKFLRVRTKLRRVG